jgi:hypothetical protein
MIRTQIQLTEEQAQKLEALAASQNTSMAELIRQSVDALLSQTREPDPAEKRHCAIAAAGRFHSGKNDLSTRHDDYLEQAHRT